MDRLTKPKEFLEKLGLSDSDYQDSGMINHIADLLERYHAEQLRLGGVVGRSELLKDFVNHVGWCKRQGEEKNLSEYVEDFLVL